MQTAAVVLLAPIVFAGISSAWLAEYARQWRSRDGVSFFSRFWLLVVILMTGYLLEVISLTLEQKVFWDAIQWIPFALLGIALLEFAVLYTQQEATLPRLVRRVIALPALAFIPIVATSSLHTLIYDQPTLIETDYFVVLTYPFTPLITLISVYMFACVLLALLLLLDRLRASSRAGRVQITYICISLLIPILVIFIPGSLNWTFLGLRDLTPLGFALGNVVMIVGVLRERLFQITPVARDLIVESLSEIVLVVDGKGRILDHNQGLMRFAPAGVLIGEPAARVVPFWEPLMAHRHNADSGAFQFHGDVHFMFHDRRYIFDVFANPFRQNDGKVTGTVIVAQDVTVERAASAAAHEREQLSRELETQRLLSEAQTHLIRRIAHEFRIPMSIIRLNHDLLIRYSERLSDEQRYEKLSLINRQIDHMDAMLQQLHDVLINRETIPVQPEVVDLKAVLDEVLLGVRATDCAARTIDWAIEPQAQSARIDPNLLRLWLNNLIGNACKYSPPDSPIEVRARVEEEALVLEVRDYGIGIPQQALPHLFDPFYRAPNTTAQPGIGLGLSLVRDTVRAHGGEIALGGIDGEPGTRATITLPGVVSPEPG